MRYLFQDVFSRWRIKNFYIVLPYSVKVRVTKTGIFQWLSKNVQNAIAQINYGVAQCPCSFTLAVPNQFRYPAWGVISPVEFANEASHLHYKLWENHGLTGQPAITDTYLCG